MLIRANKHIVDFGDSCTAAWLLFPPFCNFLGEAGVIFRS